MADRGVALVTGGGRGLGAAISQRLAADGFAVAVLDRDAHGAARSAAELAAGGARALGLGVDVTVTDQVEQAVERVADELGAPAVLVNNAGVARDNLLFRMSDAEWDEVIAVHLRGSFLMSRAVQRHMVPARAGRIVNVSSTSAHGNRGQVNYAAAKAGVHGLTKTMALELGPFGITVNAISPGFVPSAMSAEAAHRLGLSHESFIDQAASTIALRRVGTPADVAGAVSFLVGPDAAFVCGAVLYVAGGPWG